MRKITLMSEWADYRREVVPRDATPVQIQETRRAFFAGMRAILCAQLELSGSDISDDEACEMLESWHQESTAFAQVVGTHGESLLP